MAISVRPLEFDRYGNATGYGCKYLIYEVLDGWNAVIYPDDASHYQAASRVPLDEALAVLNADHSGRILAAIIE